MQDPIIAILEILTDRTRASGAHLADATGLSGALQLI